MDWIDLGLIALRVLVVFGMLQVVTILLVWFERKIVADMQNRIGPDRAGPWGILQTLADGVKLLFKEQVTPRKVELGLYLAAPVLAVVPAFLMFMVIPFGRPVRINLAGEDRLIPLQGADLNVGLLYVLAMSSIAVYAVVLAGWSSGSKYPLLGGVRATAQAISYEAAMGLSLVPVILFTGSVRLSEIVAYQSGSLTFLGRSFDFLPAWNLFILAPSFLIFFIAAVAETNRAPFDLVEAEQEIVGGFHTEYSGLRFALFFLAEYINIFTMSALAVTLFLGGWSGPTWDDSLPLLVSAVLPTVWFLAKVTLFLFLYVWLRATLPRLRYDQLMNLGWKRLIPASLGWLFLIGGALAVRQFGLPWG
ncbi:MAG: NADH-quinone oxidoreductase subunit NuoH [Acidimicrobiia bacterium]|nr:NADH-quinone oxidoreductase subunit NuoH [bacterium]MXX65402.1 NADH-quinone oxidoreductase subunit NuoH [Acidimicrobiia bacterium]MCY3579246.1 NADH-quinone oxidoreductase subunit NuoH [bacterium]MCY3652610.1 NADH-quinone oxidoreductase subunit NuoH [bacterium]MDE0643227.1 NADH-quinone oxidoreductase subunit NuoH [bacterium]